jgi:deoxyribose-phosphate aldolase
VVLTAGDFQLDEVYRQLGVLVDRAQRVRLFLSPSARKVLDLPAIRRACPHAELLPSELGFELRRLVEEADAVLLPTLTLSLASKLAHLDGDTAASILPIYALSRGKPVLACTQGLYGLRSDLPGAGPAFRSKLELILSGMKEVGVLVVPIVQLASFPLSGSVTVGNPAPKPAGSSSSSPALARPGSSGPVGSSKTTACNGTPEQCAGCGLCAEKNPPAVESLVRSGAARIGAAAGTRVTNRQVAQMIDHTLLKADATEAEIRKLCAEAREHGFASVCVNPGWVGLSAELLAGSPVKVCTVIGFPLGATTPTAKAVETRDAIANGATEVDMVINVGALKSGNDDLVRRDIAAVVESARGQAITKVILETALLSREEKVKACLLAKMAGADFVKTSTGFSTGGATVEDIALMRETVGPEMGVKASGGIRSAEDAQAMIAAGATRIGASASVAIAKGTSAGKGAY